MSITNERKQELIKEYQAKDGDTGVAGGPNRDHYRTHYKPHRTFSDPQERPSFASWVADFGRPTAAAIGLSAAQERRALSDPDCQPRHPSIGKNRYDRAARNSFLLDTARAPYVQVKRIRKWGTAIRRFHNVCLGIGPGRT